MSVGYKLRCTLAGHEKDVRSLSTFNISGIDNILSGSRDVTARTWMANKYLVLLLLLVLVFFFQIPFNFHFKFNLHEVTFNLFLLIYCFILIFYLIL